MKDKDARFFLFYVEKRILRNYKMNLFNLNEYLYDLHHTTSYTSSFLLYCNAVKKLGYEGAVYSFIPCLALNNVSKVKSKISRSEYFHSDYAREYKYLKFDQVDYVIHNLKAGKMTLMDWHLDNKSGQLNSEQQYMLDVMRNDYQMTNGLSIPLMACAKGIAASSVVSDEKDRFFHHLKAETYETLVLITQLFHNHVIANGYEFTFFIEPAFSVLNPLERQVLKLLLDGLKVPEIRVLVFRSKGHIENVVRDIRIKVGGRDKEGAIKLSTVQLIHYCGLLGVYDWL